MINRFGGKIKDSIKESNENVKNMSKENFEKTKKDWVHILDDLAKQWKKQASVKSCKSSKNHPSPL